MNLAVQSLGIFIFILFVLCLTKMCLAFSSFFLINDLLSVTRRSSEYCIHLSKLSTMITKEYDFIIVGGGASGLVVANRLSADPNMHVLVVEAGGSHDDDPRVKIPALYDTLKTPETDWKFATKSQVLDSFQRSLVY